LKTEEPKVEMKMPSMFKPAEEQSEDEIGSISKTQFLESTRRC